MDRTFSALHRMCAILPGILFALWLLSACAPLHPSSPIEGEWRGVLETAGGDLGFRLEVRDDGAGGLEACVRNGEESLPFTRVEVQENRVKFVFDHYDSYVEGTLDPSQKKLTGSFCRNKGDDFKKLMNFTAYQGEETRFAPLPQAAGGETGPDDIAGGWNMTFGEGENAWPAHAMLEQEGTRLRGTMLTRVGDFRYLAGSYEQGKIRLSVFDGAHCFLFHASVTEEGVMKGEFFSGATSRSAWTACRGENQLPDPWTLTTIVNEEQSFSFAFPDRQGNMVTHEDSRFQGKPLVFCILGTWCPNCHDIGLDLAGFYEEYHDQGLEMVALACEFSTDFTKNSEMAGRFAGMYGMDWPILILGTSDKAEVGKALPDLNRMWSYPTTLFIDRQGKVQKIFTGYTGPGTGEYHEILKEEFTRNIESLL